MLVGTSASRYLYVPATSNLKEYVRPGPRMGEANVPVVETTWWLRVSSFRQRMVSPATMFTVAGENDERLMETTFVAAEPAGATTRMASSEIEYEEDSAHGLIVPCSETPNPLSCEVLPNAYRRLTLRLRSRLL